MKRADIKYTLWVKSPNQNKPIYNIEIPVKWILPNDNWIYSKKEYLDTSDKRLNKSLEEIEDIRKNTDNISKSINNIVIANVLNDFIPIWQEIRLEYDIDMLMYLIPWFVSLFAYSLADNNDTLIKKDDNNFAWIFDTKMTINEIIQDTLFFVRNKETEGKYTDDWYALTNCDLKLWFNKNKENKMLFIIKFKKTSELMYELLGND